MTDSGNSSDSKSDSVDYSSDEEANDRSRADEESTGDGTEEMTAAEAMGQVPFGKGFSSGRSNSEGGGTSG